MKEAPAVARKQGADGLRRDRTYLKSVAYRDDRLLRDRMSLYEHQRPRIDLVGETLALLGHLGGATVLDVGCGNGQYHAGLAQAGARVVGVDLSTGMLAAARSNGAAGLVACDAEALAVVDGGVDAALAMHVLYHVPRPGDALAELARVLRPGGRLAAAINGPRHLEEATALWLPLLAEAGIDRAVRDIGLVKSNLSVTELEELLSGHFENVELRLLASEVVLRDPAPLVRHAASTSAWRVGQEQEVSMAERFAAAVRKVIEREGTFTLTTQVAVFTATLLSASPRH